MRAIINGRIVDSDGIISGKALIFDGKIQATSDSWDGCDVIDAGGGYVTPGLIDVHTHGYLGADASDGDLPGLTRMAEGMARNGVTAFLPTTMTVSYEQLETAFGVVRNAPRTGRAISLEACRCCAPCYHRPGSAWSHGVHRRSGGRRHKGFGGAYNCGF